MKVPTRPGPPQARYLVNVPLEVNEREKVGIPTTCTGPKYLSVTVSTLHPQYTLLVQVRYVLFWH